jgi:hypothetical protein
MVLGRNYEGEGAGGMEKDTEKSENDDEECEKVLQSIFDVITLFAGATNMSHSASAERVTRNLKVGGDRKDKDMKKRGGSKKKKK